ncbi:cbb3-type cytochrome c oxidase N-terminal domain-containing protein [Ekhidna sp. MALMAid0563]|uniref:cbb3-type cytochrome c oxidase N-terminal domain-containing protein n=1 Tax=Ekhidna sp. MALMAid0563 TaxID=3143937 RepID=UPI0032E00A21
MSKLKYVLSTLIFTIPGLTMAQEEASPQSFFEQYQIQLVLGLAVVVAFVAIIAMYTLLVALKVVLKLKRAELGIEEEEKELIPAVEGEEGVGFWRRFWNRINDSVPVAKEHEVATDHEYDGIRELDNRLPPWWLYGFYVSIIFAVVYLINYEVLGTGPTQDEEFQAEMMQAKEDVQTYLASLDNLIDESNVTLLTETADLDAGRAIYEQNCSVCHAADGGGGVGPNFTDEYWLHGGDMTAIFSTIKYGVPAKGMIAWEAQLSPKKMQQVASYIYMMEGQTSANPKEPQGDLFERSYEADVSPDADVEIEEADPNPETNPDYVDDEAALEEGECC